MLSRLQRFDFRRIGPSAIRARLEYVAREESIEVDDDALLLIARVANGGMRDALSLLDQALAFGTGAVTAARVRDALGLIDDEMYAELLDLVAERRMRDVFPFVGRLMEGGADLSEFVAGAGEALRAVLMRIVGGQPEGLTETLKAAVNRHAATYSEGDLLRMLKLLAEAEGANRRSPNARLYVETLLLQWTLLDRTVELADVMNALGRGGERGGEGAPRRASSSTSTPPPLPAPADNPRTARSVSTASGGTEVQRLDRAADREERLHMFRSRDAALDAVADALDLELLE